MPDLLSHTIFARDVYSEISDLYISKYIDRNMKLFITGAQGPDVFLYHKFWPWSKDKSIQEIGNYLHNNNIEQFLEYGLEYCKKNKEVIPYFMGYVCHICSDEFLHQYIEYIAIEGTRKYNNEIINITHQANEMYIDQILWEEKYFFPAYKVKLNSLLETRKDIDEVVEFLHSTILDVCNIEVNKADIVESFGYMRQALGILTDRTKIKNAIFDVLGLNKINPKPFYSKKADDKIDFMNNNRNEWYAPKEENKDKRYNFTVYELFDGAKNYCVSLLLKCNMFLEDKLSSNKDIFTEIRYNSNKYSIINQKEDK